MAAHLDRIATRDPTLHAVVALDPDARTRAAEADRALQAGRDPGPLLGIPFGVKDIIDVAGLPTPLWQPTRVPTVRRRRMPSPSHACARLARFRSASSRPTSSR